MLTANVSEALSFVEDLMAESSRSLQQVFPLSLSLIKMCWLFQRDWDLIVLLLAGGAISGHWAFFSISA